MYVGNAYPHKNLEKYIDAFEEVVKKRKNIQLVLVGKRDFFSRRLERKVKQMGLSNKIIFTGYVEDSELTLLYKEAEAFVFPSLLEGFGLPPIEAMNQGVAVISSDLSCMPEILESAAIYFDPKNTKDMMKKTELILDDLELREKMIEQGRVQVKKYSWKQCAGETINIYNENK